MLAQSDPMLALSTWSVHRALGVSYPNSPGEDTATPAEPTWGNGTVSLLDLPARVAEIGIRRMEVCHFHLPGHDRSFLGAFRSALDDAGVVLQTLLIDNGDITRPQDRRRDIDWIGRWIDVAAFLGAERARVVAGKQKPSPETLEHSVAGLKELGRRGSEQGVRVMTENWFDLLAGPKEVNIVLDRLDGEVGFLADFGNWKGPTKYADLEAVLGRAEDTHAKAFFPDGTLNDDDFGRCLAAARTAGYAGPYTLIYESPGDDEWGSVAVERDFVRDFFASRVH
jgi:sugar phosphate isomerase/epimerase